MLNKQGFDLWANEYDKTVQVYEENNLYPFAGYKTILNTIFNEIMQKKESRVFDIGFGTGVLTSKLYDNGHLIEGMDFSAKMIEIAQQKMPDAKLVEWDITKGLPDFVNGRKYDSIISTYTMHHLGDKDKVKLIKELLPLLSEEGNLFIGDISFETREQLEICKKESINYWDDDEYYFVFKEIITSLQDFCQCEFHPVSHCGGVIIISR